MFFLGFIGVGSFLLLVFLKPQEPLILEFFLAGLQGKDIYFVVFWDLFSFLFSFIVLFISSMVFLYAMYYMDKEENRLGFTFLLTSFVISMLLLLLSPNFFSLLLGWDGLGVTSYLLVIFYNSSSSSVAGMLTFLTNRLGDIFFLLSLAAMSFLYDWEKVEGSFILLSLLMGVTFFTKSAQVPFSSWLPAAMAAPTPVSSLVHSSTLVTAGLYLMIRFSALLLKVNFFILIGGVLTLLVAGTMALMEWDLKKLIAFSTLSQLGFMVSSFAMGLVWLSFFHLLTHALFKASLFLSAGILIHNSDSSQEFRNMMVVPFQLFWVSSVVNICLICLCGVPFSSGFYSKDLIVDGGSFSFMLLMMYLVGVMLTIVYSSRFFFHSFRFFSLRVSFSIFYEKVFFVVSPLMILFISALLGGWFFFEVFFSFSFWVILPVGWKMMYFFMFFSFLFLSWKLNSKTFFSYVKKFFFSGLWYLKVFFSSKSWKKVFDFGTSIQNLIDQGLWEKGGPQGFFFILSVAGGISFLLQSFMVISFMILMLSFLLTL